MLMSETVLDFSPRVNGHNGLVIAAFNPFLFKMDDYLRDYPGNLMR